VHKDRAVSNGAYREIACRDLLRQLGARGLITLPPHSKPRASPAIAIGPPTNNLRDHFSGKKALDFSRIREYIPSAFE